MQECQLLIDASERWVLAQSFESLGLSRCPVLDLGWRAQALCRHVLCRRLLPFLDLELPEAAKLLSATSMSIGTSARPLAEHAFVFATGEPTVNRCTKGGLFSPHVDNGHALTMLCTLDEPAAFTGGGTNFWPEGVALGSLPAPVIEGLTPPRGTAILFHGDVMHAGHELHSGVRHLLVATFTLYEPGTHDLARLPGHWFEDDFREAT